MEIEAEAGLQIEKCLDAKTGDPNTAKQLLVE